MKTEVHASKKMRQDFKTKTTNDTKKYVGVQISQTSIYGNLVIVHVQRTL